MEMVFEGKKEILNQVKNPSSSSQFVFVTNFYSNFSSTGSMDQRGNPCLADSRLDQNPNSEEVEFDLKCKEKVSDSETDQVIAISCGYSLSTFFQS